MQVKSSGLALENPTSYFRSSRNSTITFPLRSWIRAVRRRHCVGGGARVNFGRRRRRATGPKKSAAAAARRGRPKTDFSKIHEKFRSILKMFLGTFLVIKALRLQMTNASGQ